MSDAVFPSLLLVGFLAAVATFWRHPRASGVASALLVCIAAVAVFLSGWGVLVVSRVMSGADRSVGLNSPVAALVGLLLLCIYFGASLVSLFPFFPSRLLRRTGILLHFCILPIAVALIQVGQVSFRGRDFLFGFSYYFCILLAFGLICFRVYDRRQTIDRNA
jgi:hypothetical protein